MATNKDIGRLLRAASAGGASAYEVRQARRALRAVGRARALERFAKRAVGDERIVAKMRASKANQRAASLSMPILRPTMTATTKKMGPRMVETETERRYEMDQIIASAALEGASLSAGMLTLMDRYVRGEITQADYSRLAGEYTADVDYAALAQAQAGAPGAAS